MLSYLFKYRLLQHFRWKQLINLKTVVIPVQIQASTTSRDSFNTHFLKLSYLFKYRLLQQRTGAVLEKSELSYLFKYRLLQPPTVVAGYGQYELSYLFKYRLLQQLGDALSKHFSTVVIPVQIQASTTQKRSLEGLLQSVVIPVQIQASTTY